jgi:uncharacterized membrane protein
MKEFEMKLPTMIKTLALGAGIMYFYDPVQGRRRRVMVRDQFTRLVNRTDDALDVALEDLRNRSRGTLAEIMNTVSEGGSPDWLLEERVRARLGRNAQHAGSIEVISEDGNVTLRGPILAEDVERTIKRITTVRGVRSVTNKLEVFQNEADIPGLQGQANKRMEKPEWEQENWSPAMRLISTTGGGLMAIYGRARGGLIGTAFTLSGLGLAIRGIANRDLPRLFGLSEEGEAISVQKAININAPRQELYNFWSNLENLQHFMAHVHEVTQTGDNRTRWKVAGPAGSELIYETVTTEQVPDELIAWETVEGGQIRSLGKVRFDPNPDGSTRITVQMQYTPPAGALGHAVAMIFGTDPKQAMDEDLVRLKSLFEDGKTTIRGRELTKEAIVDPVE